MSLTAILIGILVPAFILLIMKYISDRKQRQRKFLELGIPGPKPSFLMGNLTEMRANGMVFTLTKWFNTYGKTYAYYEGDRAFLATADVELIKQVCIKDFSSFHSRKEVPSQTLKSSILRAKGSDWKRLRMITSPTFSAKRMKEMSPLIHSLVSSLMDSFEKKAQIGKSFDIMNEFQQLTISVIGSCGFGLDIDAIKDPENVFLRKCRDCFNQITSPPLATKLNSWAFFVLPTLFRTLATLGLAAGNGEFEWFRKTAAAMIDARKNGQIKRNDLIQLMLNAESRGVQSDSEMEVRVEDDNKDDSKPTNKTADIKGKDKKLTSEEMQGQCMVFLLAGYETTSTTLSFAAYEIATHPQVQLKLQKEIDEHLPGDIWPDYVSVQKMPYLDMVFSEVLRLHTIGLGVTNRVCNEDCVVGDIPLVKGDSVQILTSLVHKDKELWGPEDTDDFVPERFTQERKSQRHPMAWLPFGGGPRNCIGMRFALMEAKICLAMMLKKFSLIQSEETQIPIQVAQFGIPRPQDGVWIQLEKRTQQ